MGNAEMKKIVAGAGLDDELVKTVQGKKERKLREAIEREESIETPVKMLKQARGNHR